MRKNKNSGPLWRTVQCYLENIAVAKRSATVKNYRNTLSAFIRYLQAHYSEVKRWSQLERKHVDSWISCILRRKVCANTLRTNVTTLRRFLNDIFAWGWKDAAKAYLFHNINLPPEDKILPRPLSPESDEVLQKKLSEMPGHYAKGLLLLRKTGMRIGELNHLELDALKKLPDGKWLLHVPLGKLHSERAIPVDDSAVAIVEELKHIQGERILEPHPVTGKPSRFLMLGSLGKWSSVTPMMMRKKLQQAAREIGLKEHVVPHMLRHTYATEMIRAGMSLPVLKVILGHRTIRMTLRYVQVTQLDIQREYLSTIDSIKNRYNLPKSKELHRPDRLSPTRPSIIYLLQTLASLMETIRREIPQKKGKKKLQRITERLKRITQDFENLLS